MKYNYVETMRWTIRNLCTYAFNVDECVNKDGLLDEKILSTKLYDFLCDRDDITGNMYGYRNFDDNSFVSEVECIRGNGKLLSRAIMHYENEGCFDNFFADDPHFAVLDIIIRNYVLESIIDIVSKEIISIVNGTYFKYEAEFNIAYYRFSELGDIPTITFE